MTKTSRELTLRINAMFTRSDGRVLTDIEALIESHTNQAVREARAAEAEWWYKLSAKDHTCDVDTPCSRCDRLAALRSSTGETERGRRSQTMCDCQELGPCGKHPKMCWIVTGTKEDSFLGECRICAELAAAERRGREEMRERAALMAETVRLEQLKYRENSNFFPVESLNVASRIRALPLDPQGKPDTLEEK